MRGLHLLLVSSTFPQLVQAICSECLKSRVAARPDLTFIRPAVIGFDRVGLATMRRYLFASVPKR